MAIIVCPKCEKKHKVKLEDLQQNVSLGKNVGARCKSCGHKFPVKLTSPVKTKEADTASTTTETKGSSEVEAKSTPGAEAKSSSKIEVGSDHKSKPEKNAKEDAEEDKESGKRADIRRICVTLSKGGVGKTTTSVNLSAGLALAGHKVLLIDTDTQGQSSYILGKKPRAGLTELLTKELAPEECVMRARKNLWLLSGGKSLAGVKRIIDRKNFGAEWTLAEAMKPIEDRYDFVIIDTAPGWDQLIVNVLFYSTEVLVPVALEVMPLQGLSEFMKSLGSIQKYRKEVALKYIVPTFMDTRVKGPETILTQLEKLYSEYICTPIRYCESLSEAPSYGKSIFEFAPGCTASSDYRELVKQVEADSIILP